MINSLYTNRDVALRELISNTSDACDKLRYLAAQNPDILQDEGYNYRWQWYRDEQTLKASHLWIFLEVLFRLMNEEEGVLHFTNSLPC